jgi:hypothetical protein
MCPHSEKSKPKPKSIIKSALKDLKKMNRNKKVTFDPGVQDIKRLKEEKASKQIYPSSYEGPIIPNKDWLAEEIIEKATQSLEKLLVYDILKKFPNKFEKSDESGAGLDTFAFSSVEVVIFGNANGTYSVLVEPTHEKELNKLKVEEQKRVGIFSQDEIRALATAPTKKNQK